MTGISLPITGSNASSNQNGTHTINRFINVTVTAWASIILVGQWAFTLYLFCTFVLSRWLNIEVSSLTLVKGASHATGGDRSLFFVHVLAGIYLSFFGFLQLVPQIRQRFRGFHRWNGRIFFILGLSGAITGLYLSWFASYNTPSIASLGVTLNGLLILISIGFAWYYAINKQFSHHLRWATHAFILVNGVWAFRLVLMGWYLVNQGPNGNTNNVDGPMDIVLSFACYLLPMAIVELLWWSNRQPKNALRANIVAVSVLFGTVVTLIGVIAALMFIWMPSINTVLAA